MAALTDRCGTRDRGGSNSGDRHAWVGGDDLVGDRGNNQTGEMVAMGDKQLVERCQSDEWYGREQERDGVERRGEGWSRLGGHRGAGDDPT